MNSATVILQTASMSLTQNPRSVNGRSSYLPTEVTRKGVSSHA